MAKPRNLGQQIKQLQIEGLTYNEIILKLNCSKGTVAYHLGKGQKEKTKSRTSKKRKNSHPFEIKRNRFIYVKPKAQKTINKSTSNEKLLYSKYKTFCSIGNRNNKMYVTPTFTVNDIINKFGENPVCYLTGDVIEINKPRTYNFDHVIPSSRGGTNELDNLEIASKAANVAKSDMTPDEFFNLCKKVLEYQGYTVTK